MTVAYRFNGEYIERKYKMRFEIRKTKFRIPQRWYWVIVANNNEVLATSERYHNRMDALEAIELVKHDARTANVEQP